MFHSLDDLKLRVPGLQKSELTALAEIGALNCVGGKSGFHRRDALWQVERVARRPGPLLESCEEKSEALEDISNANAGHSPLLQMTAEDRLVADFRSTGMTVGPIRWPIIAAIETRRYSLRRRLAQCTRWSGSPRSWLGDRPSAPRHRKRFRISKLGRRNRHIQRHHHATDLSARPLGNR